MVHCLATEWFTNTVIWLHNYRNPREYQQFVPYIPFSGFSAGWLLHKWKEVSSWFTNLKSVKLFALYSQQVCMNVTRIDPKFYIVVLVWLSRKWELQMVAWLSCAQKNCVLFKQLSPHLRVYSTYTLSLLLQHVVHISTLHTHTGGVVTRKLYLTLPRIGLNRLWTSSNYQLALVS